MIRSVFYGSIFLVALANSLAQSAERYDITNFGAVGDGVTLNTQRIQTTIEQCAKAGGGTVVVPRGEFLSGGLFLRAGVNLELTEGSVLKGSTNINDYAKVRTRIEGHFEPWRTALINADSVDHLRIHGPGTLDGNGTTYWQEFWRQRKANPKVTNLAVERPRLVLVQNSQGTEIDGVTFKDSGFWNLHLYHCRNVDVKNCRFQAPNDPPPNHAASSDGIDVDSSQNVAIQDCSFAVGDDCIALKGSKGPFATQDVSSPPVEHIRISDCTFETGGAVVTCGSEATLVRDVIVERCRIKGPVPLLRLKLRPDTGQTYQDISCRDITGNGAGVIFEVAPWKQFFDLQGQPAPSRTVSNVTITGLTGTFLGLGRIAGNPGDVICCIRLRNCDVKLQNEKLECEGVRDFTFENVTINGKATTLKEVSVVPPSLSTPESWKTF